MVKVSDVFVLEEANLSRILPLHVYRIVRGWSCTVVLGMIRLLVLGAGSIDRLLVSSSGNLIVVSSGS